LQIRYFNRTFGYFRNDGFVYFLFVGYFTESCFSVILIMTQCPGTRNLPTPAALAGKAWICLNEFRIKTGIRTMRMVKEFAVYAKPHFRPDLPYKKEIRQGPPDPCLKSLTRLLKHLLLHLTDAHCEKGFSTKDNLNFYRLVAWLRIMPGTTLVKTHGWPESLV
jgi:hypothetical protein